MLHVTQSDLTLRPKAYSNFDVSGPTVVKQCPLHRQTVSLNQSLDIESRSNSVQDRSRIMDDYRTRRHYVADNVGDIQPTGSCSGLAGHH